MPRNRRKEKVKKYVTRSSTSLPLSESSISRPHLCPPKNLLECKHIQSQMYLMIRLLKLPKLRSLSGMADHTGVAGLGRRITTPIVQAQAVLLLPRPPAPLPLTPHLRPTPPLPQPLQRFHSTNNVRSLTLTGTSPEIVLAVGAEDVGGVEDEVISEDEVGVVLRLLPVLTDS